MMRSRKLRVLSFFVLSAFACFSAGCSSVTVRASEGEVPSARVEQSDLQMRFVANGALKSTNSRIVAAPAVGGGLLRIVRMTHTGADVSKDEVVLEFDPGQQQYNLAQSASDLAQAEQEIVKARADAQVQAAQDKTALLKAKYAVRRAELEVSKNELISEIDAKKNDLALEEAKRALAQLQSDIESHGASNQAAIAVSEEKRNKALLAKQQAERNIQNMTVKAPLSGVALIHSNENANGGMFWWGMSIPEYRVGDTVGPGSTVAEIIDVSKLEFSTEIEERDRQFIKPGMPVEITVLALPGKKISGKVTNVGGATGEGFFFGSSSQKYPVTIALDAAAPNLRPGFTGHVVFLGESRPRALTIPSEAVFDQSGKTIAYVRQGGSWLPKEIKVEGYTEGRAVVANGLSSNDEIALINPQAKSESKKASSNPVLPGAQ